MKNVVHVVLVVVFVDTTHFNRKDRTSKISVKLQPFLKDPHSMQISLPGAASCLEIIAASSLRGRLAVFSSRAYKLLPYPKLDDSIYFSSPEWEQAAVSAGGDTIVSISSAGSQSRPKMTAQLSQDY